MARTQAAKTLLSSLEARRVQLERDIGQSFSWDEREQQLLGMIGDAVDRRERLKRDFAGADKPQVAAKISSELRQLEKAINDQLRTLDLDGTGTHVSERHQKAARARWDRRKGQGA